MNKPSIKHLIIICSIILISLIIVLFFQINNEKKLGILYSALLDIDSDISSGFYSSASDKLDDTYNSVFNNFTAKMFLKRAFSISAETGKYGLFTDYSISLSERFNNDTEIAAIAVYALCKAGKYEEALGISDKKLSTSGYSKLYILNLLKSGRDLTLIDIKNRYTDPYSFLFDNISLSEDMLLLLSEKIGDKRFNLDAALLNAADGDYKKAIDILADAGDNMFMDARAYIAWDYGDYKSAYRFYKNIKTDNKDPLSTLFEADLLIKIGKSGNALRIYEDFVKLRPDYSSLVYRNLYSLNSGFTIRNMWLEEGLERFPNDINILLPEAWEAYKNGDFGETAVIIDMVDTEDTQLELFKLNMMLNGRSPEHIIGNFWNIYNNAPASENVAISFANFLLKNKQHDQLDLLLRRYKEASGASDWVYCYYAVSKAMTGDYGAAEENINLAIDLSDNIANNFNSAVILASSGRYREASEILEGLIPIDGISEEYLEKIYFKLAETRYNMGDYPGAESSLKKLSAINPGDMKSSLLLKKIQDIE